jgi:hypothetical protein
MFGWWRQGTPTKLFQRMNESTETSKLRENCDAWIYWVLSAEIDWVLSAVQRLSGRRQTFSFDTNQVDPAAPKGTATMAKVIALSTITTVALDGASDPRSSWGGYSSHHEFQALPALGN